MEPSYYSAYNNIGVNYELKKDYEEARRWYYKSIMSGKDYSSPYDNLVDVYLVLNFSEEKILE